MAGVLPLPPLPQQGPPFPNGTEAHSTGATEPCTGGWVCDNSTFPPITVTEVRIPESLPHFQPLCPQLTIPTHKHRLCNRDLGLSESGKTWSCEVLCPKCRKDSSGWRRALPHRGDQGSPDKKYLPAPPPSQRETRRRQEFNVQLWFPWGVRQFHRVGG